MEKLLNLLQEFYWENRKFSNDYWLLTMTNWVENLSGAHAQTYIISKQGGFISWLVENKKIGNDIVYREWFLAKTYDKDEVGEYFEPYEEILMLLSIQDNPIEFLISILK